MVSHVVPQTRKAMQAAEALRQWGKLILCWEDATQPFSPVSASPPQPLPQDQEEKLPWISKDDKTEQESGSHILDRIP